MISVNAIATSVQSIGNPYDSKCRISSTSLNVQGKQAVIETEAASAEFFSSSKYSVRNGFNNFFIQIDKGVKNQREINAANGTEARVQVVFGVPEDFSMNSILDQLSREFPKILRGTKNKATSERIKALVLGKVKQDFGVDSGNSLVEFHPREFLVDDPKVELSEEELEVIKSQNSILNEELAKLILEFQQGSEEAFSKLKEYAREFAEEYANNYKSQGYCLNASTRFFLLGLRKEPFLSDLRLNLITVHPELRDIFETTVKQELGIRHHTVFKAPKEPGAKQFFDVGVSFALDELDELQKPTNLRIITM